VAHHVDGSIAAFGLCYGAVPIPQPLWSVVLNTLGIHGIHTGNTLINSNGISVHDSPSPCKAAGAELQPPCAVDDDPHEQDRRLVSFSAGRVRRDQCY
jgi:hypothetical protein